LTVPLSIGFGPGLNCATAMLVVRNKEASPRLVVIFMRRSSSPLPGRQDKEDGVRCREIRNRPIASRRWRFRCRIKKIQLQRKNRNYENERGESQQQGRRFRL